MGIAIYPGTRNPSYHRDLGLPLEDKLIAALDAAGCNHRSAPVFVQSCEPGSLKEMRAKGLQSRMVQLIDGSDIDLKTGRITYALRFDRPYDWANAGDSRLFAAMVSPAGLAEIKTNADGIGPWKPYIVPVKGRLDAAGRLVDVNGDGSVDLLDASTQPATTLVTDAHRAGLFVHPFTFRNENRRLAFDNRGHRGRRTCSLSDWALMAHSPTFRTRPFRGALCCSDRPHADLTALRSRPAGSPQATARG